MKGKTEGCMRYELCHWARLLRHRRVCIYNHHSLAAEAAPFIEEKCTLHIVLSKPYSKLNAMRKANNVLKVDVDSL